MPLTDLDMFPLTKALIKEVKDHRENPPDVDDSGWVPKYKVRGGTVYTRSAS